MAEMQAIIQAAKVAAGAVVKAIKEVTDLVEGSTRRNAAGNAGPETGGHI